MSTVPKGKAWVKLDITAVEPDPKLRGRDLYIEIPNKLFKVEMTGEVGRDMALELARAVEKVVKKYAKE